MSGQEQAYRLSFRNLEMLSYARQDYRYGRETKHVLGHYRVFYIAYYKTHRKPN